MPLGDHLNISPSKLAAVLGRVPPARRDDVAFGIGLGISRGFESVELVKAICDGLPRSAARACRSGVEEHRALPESLQREMLRDLALEPALANLRADPRLAGLLERELGEGPRPRRP